MVDDVDGCEVVRPKEALAEDRHRKAGVKDCPGRCNVGILGVVLGLESAEGHKLRLLDLSHV
eukprot:scaffold439488_cov29-Prasinocladus_malaysianus.AAC.1